MQLKDIRERIPEQMYSILEKEVDELRPCQEKAVRQGLFENRNLVVCTPTASGKTLIAEMISVKKILENYGKAVYIVPLKALATEKYNDFRSRYGHLVRIALAIGELDRPGQSLQDYDMIICTSEKLDSLIRHQAGWLRDIATVIVDEIHLLNDLSRGPTLEILITMLRKLLKKVQIIGLSATIGNPGDIAGWLDAELVTDSWRPVPLHKGIYLEGNVEFEGRD